MKIALIVIAVLVGLVLLLVVVGFLLPQGHVAKRELHVKRSPQEVWAVVSDFATWPTWWSHLQQTEKLPDVNGHAQWREKMKDGMTMTLETIEWTPPIRWVRRITNKDLPFGGQWILEIEPTGSGCLVRLTEEGEVYNPIFRVLSKFVFGHDATIRQCLTAMDKKLNG